MLLKEIKKPELTGQAQRAAEIYQSWNVSGNDMPYELKDLTFNDIVKGASVSGDVDKVYTFPDGSKWNHFGDMRYTSPK